MTVTKHVRINCAQELYRLLLRSVTNKALFPNEKARLFMKTQIQQTFRKYKDSKDEVKIRIQLKRALDVLHVAQ